MAWLGVGGGQGVFSAPVGIPPFRGAGPLPCGVWLGQSASFFSCRHDPNQGTAYATGPYFFMWKLIASAPFDLDLELAVIDSNGVHPLVFPCRRAVGGWINADSYQQINVHPTHWREWHKPSDVLSPQLAVA